MEKTSLDDRLAEALARIRDKAGMTQRELADRMKTNQTKIALIETGDQNVHVGEMVDWCRAVGTDPVVFLASILDESSEVKATLD